MLGLHLGISILNSPTISAKYNKHLTTVILHKSFLLTLEAIFFCAEKNSFTPVINNCKCPRMQFIFVLILMKIFIKKRDKVLEEPNKK